MLGNSNCSAHVVGVRCIFMRCDGHVVMLFFVVQMVGLKRNVSCRLFTATKLSVSGCLR